MRQDKKITIFGAFIFGALLLCFGVLYFFYSRQVLDTSHAYVLFFKGSLQGLKIGSPVTYRGIKIGQVTKINITEDVSGKIIIPVYVQFITAERSRDAANAINKLILTGWKGDISQTNFLTGDAQIQLVQKKDQMPSSLTYYRHYTLIPTIIVPEEAVTLQQTLEKAQTAFKSFTDFIKSEDTKKSVENAKKAFNSITDFINSKETKQAVKTTKDALENLDKLTKKLSNQVGPITANLNAALEEVKGAAYEHKSISTSLTNIHRTPLIIIDDTQFFREICLFI